MRIEGSMTAVDVIIICGLMLLVPRLVRNVFERYNVKRTVRVIVIFGGMLWLLFSCTHEYLYPFLGIIDADAKDYEWWAFRDIVPQLQAHNYMFVAKELFSPGRGFYITYQGVIYYFGGSVFSVLGINAFMAFWGSLTLWRLLHSFFPREQRMGYIVSMFIIFPPSVVFWSSANLKEALMYWAICHVFAILQPEKSIKKLKGKFVLFLFGAFVGALLRPHIIVPWCIGVLIIKVWQTRNWRFIYVGLLLVPLLIVPVMKKKYTFTLWMAENTMRKVIEQKDSGTFTYGKKGPIPFVSGAINTLFRPFLWKVRHLPSLFSALEIWAISLSILFCWVRMNLRELKSALGNSLMQCSVLVCVPFFFAFSYLANEGLIARQRVQLYPALIALFVIPILLRKNRARLNGKAERNPAHRVLV